MSANRQRYLGIFFLVVAVVVSILNLKRTANLGLYSPALFLIIGVVLVARSRARA